MREIKFRAWDSVRKLMLCGDDIEELRRDKYFYGMSYGKPIVARSDSDWLEFELMQYTGLKDKNGVEIFEGDILKTNSGYRQGYYIGKVHYRPSKGFIQICVIDSDEINNVKKKRSYLDIRSTYAEVIGNIHENPEFLEVK